MATTHYPGVKLYAHETANTLNASMEFDAQTLSPPPAQPIASVRGANGLTPLDISGRLLDPFWRKPVKD